MRRLDLITILLAVIMACSSCGSRNGVQKKSPVRVKTEVLAPDSGAAGTQSYVGVVEEREATAVSFTGMGVLRRMLVSEGQTVSNGQLLAEMDDTQARNLLHGAEAAMAQADDAEKRYSQLHESGSLTEAQWVEIQSKVSQARSQLAVAQKNLADCQLKAPVSGIIGKKFIGVGETAMPSQAVVSILDIASVMVKVSIPEAEVADISATTPSYIKVDAIGRSYEGGRIEKGVTADAMTHTYDVRISVANSDRKLLPGMVASVRLASTQAEQRGQLTLPVTAVQKNTDGKLFVWTVDDSGLAHRSAVTIGKAHGNRVVVTSGMENGTRVVTEGYQKLSEGTEVVF